MAVTWATVGAEAVDPRVDCTPTCQGGGRARSSLLGGVGRGRVMQDLAGVSEISPELRVRGGSFSLGGHPPHPTLFTVLVMHMHVVYRCIDIYICMYGPSSTQVTLFTINCINTRYICMSDIIVAFRLYYWSSLFSFFLECR